MGYIRIINPKIEKKMKKRLIALSIIAITLMATGCKKDTNVFSINATINNFSSDAKVYIDGYNFSCWQRGDAVLVNGEPGTISNTNNGGHTGKIALENEPTTTTLYSIYPATNATYNSTNNTYSVHLPAMQKCIIGSDGKQVINAIMGAQGEDKLDFYNLCALLKVKLPASLNVTDIYVTTFTTGDNNARVKTNKRLWGNGTVTFNGAGERPTLSNLNRSTTTELNGAPNDGGDTIYLHVVDHPSDGIYYITVPEVIGVNYEVRVNYKVNATVNNVNQNFYYHIIKRQSGNNNQLLANQIGVVDFGSITIPEPTNPDPNDFNPGLYSISSTEKVNFAKGNLVFNVTANSTGSDAHTYYWSFNTTQNGTAGYNLTMDGNTPIGGTSEYCKMSVNQGVFPDNNGGYNHATFYDWGNYINLMTQTTDDDLWFTLSKTEWAYLLYTRGVSYARFAKVQVVGANGLLLFPDEFLWPDDAIIPPTNLNSATANFSQRNFTINEFSALEAAGCVFLRANGYYDHNNPAQPHSLTPNDDTPNYPFGYYWTRNFEGNQTHSYLYFDNAIISPTSNNAQLQAGYALCVRVARRAE